MKKLSILAIVFVSLLVLPGCGIQKNAQSNFLNSLQVTPRRAPQQTFYDLNSGLQVSVLSTTPVQNSFERRSKSNYVHHLSGSNLFSAPTINYVRSMGFKEMSYGDDYNLFITIVRADVNGWNGESFVEMSVSLKDARGNDVYHQGNIIGNGKDALYMPNGLMEAYTQALERVDWSRIASFLRIGQRAAEEPQRQVRGAGDTALEQTIIRWDVQSRPQGADLFWRVVSKTPNVKSTNNKYLTTTPYEATKSLDIIGLTYQTAGNVRIILRCEKEGYLPQEKEFDVRMVLDQEEISAFFRLVQE